MDDANDLDQIDNDNPAKSNHDQFRIKTYNFWDLFLHKEQYPYIGRCYAAAKRPDLDLVSNMDPHEMWELFETIVPQWDFAVYYLFNRSKPNVAFGGNNWQRLYVDLIPRYNTPCIYGVVQFIDPNPGENYVPYPKMDLPLDTLLNIRDIMGGQIRAGR